MGEVVGAGLLAHVPTIMLPEETRRELNDGKDITLGPALEQLRADVFETLDYDTVVVLDSHWFTTVEFVVTAQDRRAGLFTAEELPRGMCRIPYDWRGDPELARKPWRPRRGSTAPGSRAIDDPYLPMYYATLNLWKFLGEGLDKRWISIERLPDRRHRGLPARRPRARRRRSPRPTARCCCIASGALSHTFWTLRELRDHEASDLEHIRTPEAARSRPRADRVVQGGRPRPGARHDAGVPAVPARGRCSPTT